MGHGSKKPPTADRAMDRSTAHHPLRGIYNFPNTFLWSLMKFSSGLLELSCVLDYFLVPHYLVYNWFCLFFNLETLLALKVDPLH